MSGEQLDEVFENTGRTEFWRSTCGHCINLVPCYKIPNNTRRKARADAMQRRVGNPRDCASEVHSAQTRQAEEGSRGEEDEEGGEMSRGRINHLTKELKPETEKLLEVARRMGALNVAGRPSKDTTKPPKKPKKGAK
jgi:hypothetical protein